MSAQAQTDLLQVERMEGVPVVRFRHRTILDPLAVQAVGERLVELVQGEGCSSLVLDFARVESLTSAMFSKFVVLQQAMEQSGGKVVFCHVDPFLRQIFDVCRLPASIPIYPTLTDALQAVRPG